MSLKKFQKYNESAKHRKGRSWNLSGFVPKNPPVNNDAMPLRFSDRLGLALIKMSDTGNKIAKDLIEMAKNKTVVIGMSYFDVTKNLDTLSYLQNDNGISETEAYRVNKRGISKIYKIIKTIFGSKYTKNEVQKFVSVYKSICSKAPDSKLLKTKKVLTDKETLQKIVDDTIVDKLMWTNKSIGEKWKIYVSVIDLTINKKMRIDLYVSKLEITDAKTQSESEIANNSFLIITCFDGSKEFFSKRIIFKDGNLLAEFKQLKDMIVENE